MEKILIIEDEEKLARFIELELVHEGYEVFKASDGKDGLSLFKARPFDLVLLDIMLPGISGIEVLRRIRQESDTPVILLTARDSVHDKVTGLDLGADDYVTKPFAIEELLARIRAILRKQKKNVLRFKDLVLDFNKREVYQKGDLIDLTKTEFEILYHLLLNKGMVLTREQLLQKVWGYDYLGETNTVDVYIRYLRAKIEEPYNEKVIQTVRGVGYIIKE
ncbi:MAG: response regulator transcription factor [Clostridiaceae bacterium]|nr:response regulator transcription factor [Clostridiaceae bacterium]